MFQTPEVIQANQKYRWEYDRGDETNNTTSLETLVLHT